MCSIRMQAMTNDYNAGQSWDQISTINYHQGQQSCHYSLMGELATKTRPGSTGTVHMMGGDGRLERIRGSREVHCHEVAEGAAMLVGKSLANKQHPHKAAQCAAALAALVLAGEKCCHEVVECAAMLVARALPSKQHCHEAAKHARTGTGQGATQSTTAIATVMAMAKMTGMATMALW
jgi:hypothetical protein